MLGCDLYGYDGIEGECVAPRGWGYVSSLYFIVFIILGALILLSLFIGVVTTAMSEAEEDAKREEQLFEHVEAIKESLGMSEEDIHVIHRLFFLMDVDREGSISFNELDSLFRVTRHRGGATRGKEGARRRGGERGCPSAEH